jgi:hypothetical protein
MEHLPEAFQDASREEQIQIADLGIQSWIILKKEVGKVKDLDYTKLTEKFKEEGRKEGKREGERESAKLLKEKEYGLDDLTTQVKALEKKLGRLDAEKQKELEDLTARLKKEAERDRDAIMREAALAERTAGLQKVREYEVQIAQLQAKEDWKVAYENNQKLLEQLRKELEGFTKTRTSYEIGQEGEEETEGLLFKIPEWDCERVSKEKHKGDFRMISRDKRTFILDSKKYKDNVQKKERDKIVSDVDADANISGGIMVSLNSKISTKENCEIETTPGKKPICYLNLVGMTSEAKIAYIASTLKFLHQYVASHDEREKNELVDRMREAGLKIGELKKETENIRNKAKEVYDSLRINVSTVQSIMDFLLQMPSAGHEEVAEKPKKARAKKNESSQMPSPASS